MSEDTITWSMQAYDHKDQLLELHQELSDALANNRPLAIRRLFELLPLSSPEQARVEARGDVEFQDGAVSNIADDSVEMTYDDNAMGKVYLTIPAVFSSAATVEVDGTVVLRFEGELVVAEVPRIEERGFDRSIYQKIREIRFGLQRIKTRMEDEADAAKVLWLDVALVPQAFAAELHGSSGTLTMALDLGVSCGGGGGGDGSEKWYVYRRNNGGLCQANDASYTDPAYSRHQGPFDSEGEAWAWVDSHCDGASTCSK